AALRLRGGGSRLGDGGVRALRPDPAGGGRRGGSHGRPGGVAGAAGGARRFSRPGRVAGPNPYMASEVNRRTANGGRLFSFRSVITGLRLTQPLLAASGTFGGRCQPQAAPNPYPRVGRPDLQRALATAGSSPRPSNSSVPPRRPLQPAGSRTQSLPVTGFSPENAPFRWKPSIIVHEQASRKC